jgi:NitT/TauT family transport system substrate-binding protein
MGSHLPENQEDDSQVIHILGGRNMKASKDRALARGWRSALLGRVSVSVVAGLTLTSMAAVVPSSVSSASTKLTTLNVVLIGSSMDVPTVIGMDAGIFAHYGLKLNLSFVASPTIVAGDILGGTDQIGFLSTGALISADAAGEGIKYISNIEVNPSKFLPFPNNSYSLMVASGSSITSAAQLMGKTVGLGVLAGAEALQIAVAVTTAGGDWSKVNKVQVPYANMPAELANGTIAAAGEVQPFSTEPGQQLLTDLDETTAGDAQVGFSATAAYIASHPALVKAFAEAQQESILYTQANYSKITPVVLAQASGLPVSEASLFTVPTKIYFSTNLNPPGILSFEKIMQTYAFLAAGPLMPLSALVYTAPGTPMTKLMFNAAGKFIVKKTITCVKGTLTRRVTGISPKCPSGYHLKK